MQLIRTCDILDKRADRQTDRQTDTLITSVRWRSKKTKPSSRTHTRRRLTVWDCECRLSFIEHAVDANALLGHHIISTKRVLPASKRFFGRGVTFRLSAAGHPAVESGYCTLYSLTSSAKLCVIILSVFSNKRA